MHTYALAYTFNTVYNIDLTHTYTGLHTHAKQTYPLLHWPKSIHSFIHSHIHSYMRFNHAYSYTCAYLHYIQLYKELRRINNKNIHRRIIKCRARQPYIPMSNQPELYRRLRHPSGPKDPRILGPHLIGILLAVRDSKWSETPNVALSHPTGLKAALPLIYRSPTTSTSTISHPMPTFLQHSQTFPSSTRGAFPIGVTHPRLLWSLNRCD